MRTRFDRGRLWCLDAPPSRERVTGERPMATTKQQDERMGGDAAGAAMDVDDAPKPTTGTQKKADKPMTDASGAKDEAPISTKGTKRSSNEPPVPQGPGQREGHPRG